MRGTHVNGTAATQESQSKEQSKHSVISFPLPPQLLIYFAYHILIIFYNYVAPLKSNLQEGGIVSA